MILEKVDYPEDLKNLSIEDKKILAEEIREKIGSDALGYVSIPSLLEAIKMAQNDGYKVEALYPRTLYPLPTDWIKNFIKEKDVIIVIENNYNAQFKSTIVERCLHLHQGVQMIEMLKYDGTPFTPEEIYEKFRQVQKNYDEAQSLSTNKITRF